MYISLPAFSIRNFSKFKSTPLNSSIIRWNRGQLKKIYNEINQNSEFIFFTYPTIDNYFNHRWYNIHDEESGFLNPLPKKIIYSWYKGNMYPDDMQEKVLRKDHMICLFNNSTKDVYEHMHEISELNGLY